ncbi:MAG: thioredoxin reductase, partial [Nocardioidaceae bacterium]|nr:thioredoxin reductase [Nocardioidaceae bacterium]
ESVVVEDNHSHERRTIPARALFVFIGAEPHAKWLANTVTLDSSGYIVTGPDAAPRAPRTPADAPAALRPFPLETNRLGVFAVGDVRSGSIKRVAAAVGEGSMAIRLIFEHLNGLE